MAVRIWARRQLEGEDGERPSFGGGWRVHLSDV